MWKVSIIEEPERGAFCVPKLRISKVKPESTELETKNKPVKKKSDVFVYSSVIVRPAALQPSVKLPGETQIKMQWNRGQRFSKWFFQTTCNKKIFLRKGYNYFGSSIWDNIKIDDKRVLRRELSIYISRNEQSTCIIRNLKGNCIVNGTRMEIFKEQSLFSGDSVTISSKSLNDNKKLIYFVIYKEIDKSNTDLKNQ